MRTKITGFLLLTLFSLLMSGRVVHAQMQPFSGAQDTETISASTTSAAFTLGFESPQILVTVDSDVVAFIKCGTSAQTATIATAAIHQMKGSGIWTKPRTATSCAVILNTGTATVYVTPGQGS